MLKKKFDPAGKLSTLASRLAPAGKISVSLALPRGRDAAEPVGRGRPVVVGAVAGPLKAAAAGGRGGFVRWRAFVGRGHGVGVHGSHIIIVRDSGLQGAVGKRRRGHIRGEQRLLAAGGAAIDVVACDAQGRGEEEHRSVVVALREYQVRRRQQRRRGGAGESTGARDIERDDLVLIRDAGRQARIGEGDGRRGCVRIRRRHCRQARTRRPRWSDKSGSRLRCSHCRSNSGRSNSRSRS